MARSKRDHASGLNSIFLPDFAMPKIPVTIVAPAEYQIPASLSREVGRIIVRWAYLEHSIRRLGWRVLGIDQKLGRIAIRDPRLDDYIDMVADVAYLKRIQLDQAKLSNLKTKINEVAKWRDLLGHGIWIPKNGNWMIQRTSGNYPKNFKAEHRKRRINPEGVNVDLEGLRTISDGIAILIEEVLELRDTVPQPSPEKRQER